MKRKQCGAILFSQVNSKNYKKFKKPHYLLKRYKTVCKSEADSFCVSKYKYKGGYFIQIYIYFLYNLGTIKNQLQQKSFRFLKQLVKVLMLKI